MARQVYQAHLTRFRHDEEGLALFMVAAFVFPTYVTPNRLVGITT